MPVYGFNENDIARRTGSGNHVDDIYTPYVPAQSFAAPSQPPVVLADILAVPDKPLPTSVRVLSAVLGVTSLLTFVNDPSSFVRNAAQNRMPCLVASFLPGCTPDSVSEEEPAAVAQASPTVVTTVVSAPSTTKYAPVVVAPSEIVVITSPPQVASTEASAATTAPVAEPVPTTVVAPISAQAADPAAPVITSPPSATGQSEAAPATTLPPETTAASLPQMEFIQVGVVDGMAIVCPVTQITEELGKRYPIRVIAAANPTLNEQQVWVVAGQSSLVHDGKTYRANDKELTTAFPSDLISYYSNCGTGQGA